MKPLPMPTKRWHSRWVQIGDGRSLHRVAKLGVTWKAWEYWPRSDKLVAVCGKRGVGHMPGLFSRVGARRCYACCRLVKIPNGYGAPYNGPRPGARSLDIAAVKAWEPYKNK